MRNLAPGQNLRCDLLDLTIDSYVASIWQAPLRKVPSPYQIPCTASDCSLPEEAAGNAQALWACSHAYLHSKSWQLHSEASFGGLWLRHLC